MLRGKRIPCHASLTIVHQIESAAADVQGTLLDIVVLECADDLRLLRAWEITINTLVLV